MQEDGGENTGSPFLFVGVFLTALVIVGGLVLILGRKPQSTPLQTSAPSANIEKTAEPTASNSAIKQMEKVTELKIEDQKIGTGVEATAGKSVSVNYTGSLTDGTVFDSNVITSFNHVEPFTFTLGAGQVIEGWDKGVAGMKVGGKRKLTIPSSKAYGDSGAGGVIPGGATLVFEVELLKVE